MEKELRLVEQLIAQLPESDIVVMQSGIGKVAAALGTQRMILNHQPDIIISTGVAAGATLNVPRLDVVASNELMYHDAYCGSDYAYGQLQGQPARFVADARLLEKARAINKVHVGLIATGDWFVDSKTKARAIIESCPNALAIDMESAAIAQARLAKYYPFMSFRILSDIPLADTAAEQYFDFCDRGAQGSFDVLKEFLQAL